MDIEKLIDTARGSREADLLLTGGRVVNVFSGEIENASIALSGERIAGLGAYESGARIIDLEGKCVIPGLIDAHIHIESSLLTPAAFAAAALPHGTTAIIADPHEILNVGGIDAWRYMVESARGLPVDIFYTVSSCVPATHMETSGASMGPGEIAAAFDIFPASPALAEFMNYPGVLFKNPQVMEIIRQTRSSGRRIDGHAPLLGGRDLQAYISAGISSDHECTSLEEAREKMRHGMQIFIREGSGARNLAELLPLVNGDNYGCFSFCCDDRHAGDLLVDGEIDAILRQAVSLGMPAIQAIRLATINTARHYGFRDRGAIAPGYLADLVVVNNLEEFIVEMVVKNGRIAFLHEQSSLRAQYDWPDIPDRSLLHHTGERANPSTVLSGLEANLVNSVRLPDVQERMIADVPGESRMAGMTRMARVIEVLPDQVLTRSLLIPVEDLAGSGLSYAAVVERHGRNGNIGTGLVKGLGLREGALASTVAHDSHNLIIAGCDNASMELAARTIADMGGGLAVVAGGQVLASLPLPVGGLMSPRPAAEVAAAYEELEAAAASLGCKLPAPFITLSFLALPVIPELRLTDCGLVDVGAFDLVEPWIRG